MFLSTGNKEKDIIENKLESLSIKNKNTFFEKNPYSSGLKDRYGVREILVEEGKENEIKLVLTEKIKPDYIKSELLEINHYREIGDDEGELLDIKIDVIDKNKVNLSGNQHDIIDFLSCLEKNGFLGKQMYDELLSYVQHAKRQFTTYT